ncbi:MAG: hypothetical protein VXY75_01410, partial [Bacteroidota bacterium]|nr:hypothetical protein [Bacteroidota bacterium]
MKLYNLFIFVLLFMNCSCSDNSFNNNSSADDDTTPIDSIDPEGEFYITQTIDGVEVIREVLLHLPDSFDNTQT